MDTLVLAGMLAGCAWAGAGLLGYPGVTWKPGAVIAVVCAVWVVGHGGTSPEVVEACAFGIFLVLMFARQWLFTGRKDTKPGPPDGT